MTLFRRFIYSLAASTIYSLALAASPLENVTIYSSSTEVQLGEQVTLGAKTTASVFMALAVAAWKPNGDIELVVNTTTNGVSTDIRYIDTDGENPEDLTGPSQAFSKACVDGRGMDVSGTYLPTTVGNWTFAYIVQYYYPAENGNYTFEDNKICISQPMNVETVFAGFINVNATSSENGGTSLPDDAQLSNAPTATDASTAVAAEFSPTPTGEPFSIPSNGGTSGSPSDPVTSSLSTRRFEAISNEVWSLWAFATLLFGIASGLFVLV